MENNSNSGGENPKNKHQKVAAKTKKIFVWAWPIKIGVLTLSLALMFGVLSEMLLEGANIIIPILVVVLLLGVSIIFDIIGVAFACCSLEPILAMASRKVKGSKAAIVLVRNGDKVSSVCSDVIGDMCGILSGAAGAAIAVSIIANQTGAVAIIIASVVSAVISALTVFGKAMFKKLAISKSVSIVSFVGRVVSVFMKNK